MTYRSAEDALRERTTALEAQLRTLEEKKKSAAEVDADVLRVVEDLRKSRTLLDRLEKKRALPMLEDARVASPCNANWAEMVGDDKSRYCGKCEKNVFNLSAMTRDEAELLMLEKEGNLCIRLYRRKDGTVLTQDCPVGVRKKRLRLVGVLAIGGGVVAAAAGFATAALTSQQATVTMGDMEPTPSAHPLPTPAPSGTTAVMGEMEPEPEPPPAVEMGKRAAPPPPAPVPKPPAATDRAHPKRDLLR